MTGISELDVLGLGAFAGLTIFLGLAIGLHRSLSVRLRAFLSALASGILLFLFFDVLNNADAMIGPLIPAQGTAGANGTLAVAYIAVLLGGWTVGFLSLAAFEHVYTRRLLADREVGASVAVPSAAAAALDPLAVSTMIAIGVGLHNFSEGLAIGASFTAGAIAAGTVLAIGFAAHNSTEGFGILGPGILTGRRYSPMRLAALGAIGGGPTFLGTLVGSVFFSSALSILFFGLAAGAIIYVVLQMVRPMMTPTTRTVAWFGVVVGFILGFATDAIVAFGGG